MMKLLYYMGIYHPIYIDKCPAEKYPNTGMCAWGGALENKERKNGGKNDFEYHCITKSSVTLGQL